VAAAGARVAEDHDGRRARAPALADIGAHGFLADGVEVELLDVALEAFVVFAMGEFDFEPVGLAEGWLGGGEVEHRNKYSPSERRLLPKGRNAARFGAAYLRSPVIWVMHRAPRRIGTN
jgi:hypothetical protein